MTTFRNVAHADVSVIVDGAVESDSLFTDYLLMDAFVKEVEADAHGHGHLTEIRVLYHDHEIGIDCECAQTVTDHTPLYTFNQKDET